MLFCAFSCQIVYMYMYIYSWNMWARSHSLYVFNIHVNSFQLALFSVHSFSSRSYFTICQMCACVTVVVDCFCMDFYTLCLVSSLFSLPKNISVHCLPHFFILALYPCKKENYHMIQFHCLGGGKWKCLQCLCTLKEM